MHVWPRRRMAPLRGLKEVLTMGGEGYSRLMSGVLRALQSLLALDRTRY
jgi:cellulose synthase (UDP-forming)